MTDGYRAALQTAAWFMIHRAGIVQASGPDAASFLNNISTNDVARLQPGEGCETYFCDHRARVLFHANVRRADCDFLLDTSPSQGEALLCHMDKYLISEAVELVDRSTETQLIHVVGPGAAAILGEDASGLPKWSHRVVSTILANAPIVIRRRDWLGLPGYDFFSTPGHAELFTAWLEQRGVAEGTSDDFELLRVEAGVPLAGIDFDDGRFVMEVANAARAVCYTKGCFIGQEPIVMARDRAGQINRKFVGLKVLEGGPIARGTKIMRDAAEVGLATSSVYSERLGAPLALGYIRRPDAEPGTILRAGEQPVEVLGYPPLAGRSGG